MTVAAPVRLDGVVKTGVKARRQDGMPQGETGIATRRRVYDLHAALGPRPTPPRLQATPYTRGMRPRVVLGAMPNPKTWLSVSRIRGPRPGTASRQESGERHGKSAASADVDRMMQGAKPSADRETVAFLGPTSSGKAVVAALVKHTLSTSWVSQSGGVWEARTESGHGEIDDAIMDIKQGRFPPAAIKDAYPPLKIGIYRMKGHPLRTVMTIRDTPGEDYYVKLAAHKGSDDINGLIADLLMNGGAHIVHATKYVLMIDCAETGWRGADVPQAVNTLNAIHRIKRRVDSTDVDGQIMAPIALAFTKADALPGAYKDLAARDLADKCRGLVPSLQAIHRGTPACFKLHVRVSSGCPRGQSHNVANDAACPEQPMPRSRTVFGIDYSACEYYRLIDWVAGRHDPNRYIRRIKILQRTP